MSLRDIDGMERTEVKYWSIFGISNCVAASNIASNLPSSNSTLLETIRTYQVLDHPSIRRVIARVHQIEATPQEPGDLNSCHATKYTNRRIYIRKYVRPTAVRLKRRISFTVVRGMRNSSPSIVVTTISSYPIRWMISQRQTSTIKTTP